MTTDMKCILGLVLAAACFTGCGGSGGGVNSTPFNPNPSANGSWTGGIAFHNSLFPTSVDMFIIQTGTSISSRFVMFNGLVPVCSPIGSMTGEVNGTNVTMTIVLSSTNTTTVTATLNSDTINGTFKTTGSCDPSDEGDISLEFIPSITSSKWSGSITPTTGPPIPLTANINEDQAGILTGSVSLPGAAAPCDSPINVNGGIVGRYMYLMGSQALLNAYGQVDSTGKNISNEPNDTATGTCVPPPGSYAAFSMTRP